MNTKLGEKILMRKMRVWGEREREREMGEYVRRKRRAWERKRVSERERWESMWGERGKREREKRDEGRNKKYFNFIL